MHTGEDPHGRRVVNLTLNIFSFHSFRIANVVGEHANFKSAAEDNINALFGDDDSTQELEENNAEVESFSENYTNSMDEMDHITSEAKKILENPINDISFGKRIQGDDDNFEVIKLIFF